MPVIKIEEIIQEFPQTTLDQVRKNEVSRHFPAFINMETTEVFTENENRGRESTGLFYRQTPRGGLGKKYVLLCNNSDPKNGVADITLAIYNTSPASSRHASPLEHNIVVEVPEYISRESTLNNAINRLLSENEYVPGFVARVDLNRYPGTRQASEIFDGLVCNKTYGNGQGVLIRNHDGAYDLFSAQNLRKLSAKITESPSVEEELTSA